MLQPLRSSTLSTDAAVGGWFAACLLVLPPGVAKVIPVAPHRTETLLETTIALAGDDFEVLITVGGLPGYEERLSEPVSRTITFDPSLCSEIVNTATE
jgi:hypothetical protein